MSTTFLSFGPSTPGDPPEQYGFLVNMTLADVQSAMTQALVQSNGLFIARQMVRNGERDVLINAHQVRYAVARG